MSKPRGLFNPHDPDGSIREERYTGLLGFSVDRLINYILDLEAQNAKLKEQVEELGGN
jgi:hypothetical protein